jgi:TPR repeat protein
MFTTLKEIYDKYKFINYEEDYKIFKYLEDHIVGTFNQTYIPSDFSDDTNILFWNGVFLYDKNVDEAVRYWKLGTGKGCIHSTCRLGLHYFDTNDYENSNKYLKIAIDAGSTTAMTIQGDYYNNIEHNKAKSHEIWMKSADLGSTLSMIKLGRSYIDEESCTNSPNYTKGTDMLKRAAVLNDKDAIMELGFHYYVAEKNYAAAIEYLKCASDKGCSKSMFYLAKYYANIEKNPIKSVQYLQMSIGLNNTEACDALTSGLQDSPLSHCPPFINKCMVHTMPYVFTSDGKTISYK